MVGGLELPAVPRFCHPGGPGPPTAGADSGAHVERGAQAKRWAWPPRRPFYWGPGARLPGPPFPPLTPALFHFFKKKIKCAIIR